MLAQAWARFPLAIKTNVQEIRRITKSPESHLISNFG